ncbi:unnamed protein product [Cylicocyclus nassatus]|uniref:Uncharacterized protein n=1 Tax=Cylicocyclus nassatus TaxID=53992 RepID=A0AA36M691_CYLNA|nr:unnamed protein product [Cylicocyclus nassatus]
MGSEELRSIQSYYKLVLLIVLVLHIRFLRKTTYHSLKMETLKLAKHTIALTTAVSLNVVENDESKRGGYIMFKSGRMPISSKECELTVKKGSEENIDCPDEIQTQFAMEHEQRQAQVVDDKSPTDPCPPGHCAECNSTARSLMVNYASHVLAHCHKSVPFRRDTIERTFHSQFNQAIGAYPTVVSKKPKPLWLNK